MRRLALISIVFSALPITPGSGWAAAGDLDPSFRSGGVAVTQSGLVEPFAILTQPDGKIVAGGAGVQPNLTVFGLARHHLDGSLDTSFGNGGVALTPIGSFGFATAVARQPDGKLVAAGQSYGPSQTYEFTLVRYEVDGTLDTSFGADGVVTTPVGSSDAEAFALVLQPDGKLVVAGGNRADFVLARYQTDGNLDPSFGIGGIAITPVGSGFDEAHALALQPDGKLLAAGTAEEGFALARYTSTGSLDATFGNGGIVLTPIENQAVAFAMLRLPSGKIVVAGGAKGGDRVPRLAVARYTSNGSLDSSFGSGGTVTTLIGLETYAARSVVAQPNGRIIVVGTSYPGGAKTGFAAARYLANGKLDPSFGNAGTVVAHHDTWANAAVLQSNGKLLVAGFVTSIEGGGALARFEADGVLDVSFGNADPGKVITPFGTTDLAFALTRQGDGKLVAAGYVGPRNGGITEFSTGFGLARYNEDGTLDPKFGDWGEVVTPIDGHDASATSVLVQPDGKIVAAGQSGGRSFALARYQKDGGLDPSFGTGGIVTTAIGEADSGAWALVRQEDGKLVAAGFAVEGGSLTVALVRYRQDGSLDTSFGGGGIVTTAIAGGANAQSLVVQPDGKLVVGGPAEVGGGTHVFALARYQPDGSLDASFGTSGIVTTAIADTAVNFALVLQPDLKLVAAGGAVTGEQENFALARYNADGSPDGTFGTGGVVTTPQWGGARALAVQPDGKLIAAGELVSPFVLGLIRYDSDGSVDTTFGNGGLVATDFGGDSAGASALLLQPGGQIVAAGYASVDSGRHFALARYQGDLASELIPGGGLASADCLAEWRVSNPFNAPLYDRMGRLSSRQICADNDPRCDFDGGLVGSCTFRLSLCANVTDPTLSRCSARPLASARVLLPTSGQASRSPVAAANRVALLQATDAILSTLAGECTTSIDIVVPLRVSAVGFRPSRTLFMTRVSPVSGAGDLDLLMLGCTP
jgi:uncharacterized delta-60 repeat protein